MCPSISRSSIDLLELHEALRLFLQEQSQAVADETSQLAVEPLIKGQLEIKTLLDHWLKFVEVIFDTWRKTIDASDFPGV